MTPEISALISIIAIVTLNEIWWYALVAVFFGAGLVRRSYMRRSYIKAKVRID